jgi:hypothetical protein
VKQQNPDQVPDFLAIGMAPDAFIGQRPYTVK